MKLDPRHLPAVLAIVEQGSFARAAQSLGLSQPALSKHIAVLERRLEVRLFDRSAKGAKLTDAGQVLLRSARNLDALLKAAELEVKAAREGSDAPLTVGVSPSLMLRLVPDTLARLAREGLTAQLTVYEERDDVLARALRDGELDLVAGPLEALHAGPDDLIEVPLAQDSYYVGVNPHHRLVSRPSLRLGELQDEAWLLPMPGTSHYRVVQSLFVAAGLPWPKTAIETNSMQVLEQLIASTECLCIVSGVMVMGPVRTIEPIVLEGAPSRRIGIKQRRGYILPAYAQRFIQCLKDAYRALTQSSALK